MGNLFWRHRIVYPLVFLLLGCSTSAKPARDVSSDLSSSSQSSSEGGDSLRSGVSRTIPPAASTVALPVELLGTSTKLSDLGRGSEVLSTDPTTDGLFTLVRNVYDGIESFSIWTASSPSEWKEHRIDGGNFTPRSQATDGQRLILVGSVLQEGVVRPATREVAVNEEPFVVKSTIVSDALAGNEFTSAWFESGSFWGRTLNIESGARTLVTSPDGITWRNVVGTEVSAPYDYVTNTSYGPLRLEWTLGENGLRMSTQLLDGGGSATVIPGFPSGVVDAQLSTEAATTSMLVLLDSGESQMLTMAQGRWSSVPATIKNSYGKPDKLNYLRELHRVNERWYLLGQVADSPTVLVSTDGRSWKESSHLIKDTRTDWSDVSITRVGSVPLFMSGMNVSEIDKATRSGRESQLSSVIALTHTESFSVDHLGSRTVIVAQSKTAPGQSMAARYGTIIYDPALGVVVKSFPASNMAVLPTSNLGNPIFVGTTEVNDKKWGRFVSGLTTTSPSNINELSAPWKSNVRPTGGSISFAAQFATDAKGNLVVQSKQNSTDGAVALTYEVAPNPIGAPQWLKLASPFEENQAVGTICNLSGDIYAFGMAPALPTTSPNLFDSGKLVSKRLSFDGAEPEWVEATATPIDIGRPEQQIGTTIECDSDQRGNSWAHVYSASKITSVVTNDSKLISAVSSIRPIARSSANFGGANWWDDSKTNVSILVERKASNSELQLTLFVDGNRIGKLPLRVDNLRADELLPQISKLDRTNLLAYVVHNEQLSQLTVTLPAAWISAIKTAKPTL